MIQPHQPIAHGCWLLRSLHMQACDMRMDNLDWHRSSRWLPWLHHAGKGWKLWGERWLGFVDSWHQDDVCGCLGMRIDEIEELDRLMVQHREQLSYRVSMLRIKDEQYTYDEMGRRQLARFQQSSSRHFCSMSTFQKASMGLRLVAKPWSNQKCSIWTFRLVQVKALAQIQTKLGILLCQWSQRDLG